MDNLDFNLEETEKKGDIYFSNNVTAVSYTHLTLPTT